LRIGLQRVSERVTITLEVEDVDTAAELRRAVAKGGDVVLTADAYTFAGRAVSPEHRDRFRAVRMSTHRDQIQRAARRLAELGQDADAARARLAAVEKEAAPLRDLITRLSVSPDDAERDAAILRSDLAEVLTLPQI
jgi:chromosome segregation ATPase